MDATLFTCKTCESAISVSLINSEDLLPCPTCGSSFQIRVYPALFEDPKAGQAPEQVVLDHESSCYYHEDKRATVPCDSCGRFLCALCDIEMHDEHLCPKCMQKGLTKDSVTSLESDYTCYDSLAFALATIPILVWPFTFFTAPLSIYLAIRYWNTPMSVLPRVRWRPVLAVVLSAAQIGLWGYLFLNIAAKIF